MDVHDQNHLRDRCFRLAEVIGRMAGRMRETAWNQEQEERWTMAVSDLVHRFFVTEYDNHRREPGINDDDFLEEVQERVEEPQHIPKVAKPFQEEMSIEDEEFLKELMGAQYEHDRAGPEKGDQTRPGKRWNSSPPAPHRRDRVPASARPKARRGQ